MARNNIPKTMNNLYQDKFKLVMHTISDVEFFASTVNLPGITQSEIEMDNAVNRFYFGGTKLMYDPFTITFHVDENLNNYIKLFRWIRGITAPESTDQHVELINERNITGGKPKYSNIYSDGTLFSMTNSSNANMKIIFRNMFPVSLSGLDFDVTAKEIQNATVTFRYDYYDFEPNV